MPKGVAGEIVNNAKTTSITGVKNSQLKGWGYGKVYSYSITSSGYEIALAGENNRTIGVSFAPKVDVNIFASSPIEGVIDYPNFYQDNEYKEENLLVSLLTKGCVYVPTYNVSVNKYNATYELSIIGHYVYFNNLTGIIWTTPYPNLIHTMWKRLKGARVISVSPDGYLSAIKLTGQQ